MSNSSPRRGTLTARLDSLENALRLEFRNGLGALELRLTEKLAAQSKETRGEIADLRGEVSAFAMEFKEFNGTARGVAIVLTVLVPVFTALTVFGGNLLLRHVGLPGP